LRIFLTPNFKIPYTMELLIIVSIKVTLWPIFFPSEIRMRIF
jgi:hypothetical protein